MHRGTNDPVSVNDMCPMLNLGTNWSVADVLDSREEPGCFTVSTKINEAEISPADISSHSAPSSSLLPFDGLLPRNDCFKTSLFFSLHVIHSLVPLRGPSKVVPAEQSHPSFAPS